MTESVHRRLIVHAPNVHQGGGLSLLLALLKGAEGKLNVISLDARAQLHRDVLENIQVKQVRPTLLQRLLAERWLTKTVEKEDTVLCFGNLPPLQKLKGNTVLFLQNRYLLEPDLLKEVPIKLRIRLSIERWWLKAKLDNVDEVIVQTPTMKRLVDLQLKPSVPVRVLPFVAGTPIYSRRCLYAKENCNSKYDFVYIASGENHKNHRSLIKAWCALADDGVFPSLCLTIDKSKFSELSAYIEKIKKQRGLNIKNIGSIAHNEALSLYRQSAALIYPSKLESFGLPLIEARQAGLPVLASELDYVRDILDPEEVFDPDSPISIARAVMRFMGLNNNQMLLSGAKEFIEQLQRTDML